MTLRGQIQGYAFWREMCRERQKWRCWTLWMLCRVPTSFILDDFKRLKVKVTMPWLKVFWKRRERWCRTQQRSYRKVSLGFRLTPSNLTLGDPEGSTVNVKILWFEISRKLWEIRGWTPGSTFFESSHGLSIGTVRFDLGWHWWVKNH